MIPLVIVTVFMLSQLAYPWIDLELYLWLSRGRSGMWSQPTILHSSCFYCICFLHSLLLVVLYQLCCLFCCRVFYLWSQWSMFMEMLMRNRTKLFIVKKSCSTVSKKVLFLCQSYSPNRSWYLLSFYDHSLVIVFGRTRERRRWIWSHLHLHPESRQEVL